MHMADALVSPAVGGTMWVATAAATVYCAKKVRKEADQGRIPLMGVLGAFVFAAQMVNFTIPGTGASGHITGGLILAILLGPEAAFLVMASVLAVQALFLADGGLLALGCNVFNLGVLPAFVAYPLVYRLIFGRGVVGRTPAPGRAGAAAVIGGVVALQLGAFAVVLETTLSGVSALPFAAFAGVMLPIHLAIGLVEGAATAAIVGFVATSQPDILGEQAGAGRRRPTWRMIAALALVALLLGGGLAWFSSTDPDGLEWAVTRVGSTLKPQVSQPDGASLEGAGTSVEGLVGSAVTVAAAIAAGVLLRRRKAHTP